MDNKALFLGGVALGGVARIPLISEISFWCKKKRGSWMPVTIDPNKMEGFYY